MTNDNGYSRAEKEFLEPPDDEVGECEWCGSIDVLTEYQGSIVCSTCKQSNQDQIEEEEIDDDDRDDDEIFFDRDFYDN